MGESAAVQTSSLSYILLQLHFLTSLLRFWLNIKHIYAIFKFYILSYGICIKGIDQPVTFSEY